MSKKLGWTSIVMIASALAVALAVVQATPRPHRPEMPVGFVRDMKVVDDSAVLLWTASYPHRPIQDWVSRVDAAGRTLWWRPLPAPAILLGADALQVGDGVVAVRYSHQ